MCIWLRLLRQHMFACASLLARLALALDHVTTVRGLLADAEEESQRASREADSSSLGSSKQPTTPQPPGGAAVETDAEGAAPVHGAQHIDPPAADEAPVAEALGRGGAGSPASGSVRSAMGRKGSDRSAPSKRNGSRSQQVMHFGSIHSIYLCMGNFVAW